MPVVLSVLEGPDAGARIEIEGDRIVIGRRSGDLVLSDREISGTHCAIERAGEHWQVVDLESTNGVWVDGKRVAAADLPDKGRFQIGSSVLSLSTEEGAVRVIDLSEPLPAPVPVAEEPEIVDPSAATSMEVGVQGDEDLAFATLAPYILVERGRNRGQSFRLVKRMTILGRANVDLEVPDPDVSRRHAAIEIAGKGRFLIRDLASTNGTFLNGIRVTVENLSDNDKLRMGATTLKFVIGDRRLDEERRKLNADPTSTVT